MREFTLSNARYDSNLPGESCLGTPLKMDLEIWPPHLTALLAWSLS